MTMATYATDQSMMTSRRALMGGGAALSLLVILPGCQGLGSGFSLTEALKRLLTLSSQKAFAQLMAPNGFYDSQVSRITLPDQLGGSSGGSLLSRVLISTVLKDRLTRTVNRAAEKGAERAAPIVANAITSLPVGDALSILRGGGSGATDLLRGALGDQLINAMLPGVGDALQIIDNDAVSQGLKLATGLDFSGLREDVTRKASNAIYAAIAQEEIAIRANPQATNDPVLIAALTALR
jgi:hypothetical protein